MHLHAFVEFDHAVDWTSLALMVFRGSRPDAKPTRARGADQRETINQGHFYVWVWKQGTPVRALFQANNDMHTLGDSKTGIYAYQVWLYKVPIVVTVDLSAYWEPSEPWIKANCFDLFLPGPCY